MYERTLHGTAEIEGFTYELHKVSKAWQCEIVIERKKVAAAVVNGDLSLVPDFRWRGFMQAFSPDGTARLSTQFCGDVVLALDQLVRMVKVLKELGVKP